MSHDILSPCFLTNLLSTIHYSFIRFFWCKVTYFLHILEQKTAKNARKRLRVSKIICTFVANKTIHYE